MDNNMDNVKRLSDIEAKPVWRLGTGFEELDCLYGYSIFPDKSLWGLPEGKISLWAGASGIGKSRLAISVAKRQCMFPTNPRYKILYFQTESTLEDFAGWAKDTNNYHNFYCSGESNIEKMINIMYQVQPHIIFIDSVNEIDEFENGNKKEARRLIKGIVDDNGKTIKPGLRDVCNDLNCHLILLGQLNQDGKTIKGGTSLPHLVDIALEIIPYDVNDSNMLDFFTVQIGIKHRYGKKGTFTEFYHTDEGVDNISNNRLDNKIWCSTHGIKTLAERIHNTAPILTPISTQKTGLYIGLDGQPTDIITPAMQVEMDKVGHIELTDKAKELIAQMRPFLHPDEPELSTLDKLNRKVGDFFNLD